MHSTQSVSVAWQFGISFKFAPHAVSFVILGSLNLFASMIGFWASFNKKKLLMGFLVCGGVSTLLQIGLTLSLLLAFEAVLGRIVQPTDEKYKKVSRSLNIARWVSLGFIFFEIFSLVMVRCGPCSYPCCHLTLGTACTSWHSVRGVRPTPGQVASKQVHVIVPAFQQLSVDTLFRIVVACIYILRTQITMSLYIVQAVLLRFVLKEEQEYDAFDPETSEQRMSTLSSLAKDISKAAKKAGVLCFRL